jgi:hypothetical protein
MSVLQHTVIPSSPVHGTFRQHCASSLLGSIMHRVCWAASCIVEPHLFTKLLGSIVHEALVFGGQLRGPHGLLTHQVHLQTQCTDMWHQHVSTPHTTYTCKHNAQTCGINKSVLHIQRTPANTMHRHVASTWQYSKNQIHMQTQCTDTWHQCVSTLCTTHT